MISHAGGDPDLGIKLGRLLDNAGFREVFISASYDQPNSLAEKMSYYAEEGALIENSAMAEMCLAEGWASRKELAEIAEEWRRVADLPDAVFALPFGEATGWKP